MSYYNTEAYLKQFTPEQWLEAMKKLGFNVDIKELSTADGWKMVAPLWMEGFETDGIKPLKEFKNEQS